MGGCVGAGWRTLRISGRLSWRPGRAAGVHPGITSAVLGHTDPRFTMRTYQHVLDGMADQAAEALERALGGGR